MGRDDKKQNEVLPEADGELNSLDRTLSQFPDMVFSPPSELQEASDLEVARLMKRTKRVRAVPRLRILRNPRIVLALAASVSILLGGGLLFSSMREGEPTIMIAMAFPQESSGQDYVFRGGGSPNKFPDAVESGIQKVLTDQSVEITAPIAHIDAPEFADISDASLARLAETEKAGRLLYATQDQETGEFVLIVFDCKTESKRAEKRLDIIDAQLLEAEVSRVIANWLQDEVL